MFTLRSLADSDRIRTAFGESSSVVVIGAGWIGLETAAAARAAGLAVTVLESAPLPLQRVLGRRARWGTSPICTAATGSTCGRRSP
ncbi:FAD-dependent oxidoreductase [Aeromicrobium sp. UC242_57]|uniref:FAD-dependent oxidoreductase n=1 Tax=Aeromicrobium sp. UC242_57 TaxID=3374624 RepID=UPI0037919A61